VHHRGDRIGLGDRHGAVVGDAGGVLLQVRHERPRPQDRPRDARPADDVLAGAVPGRDRVGGAGRDAAGGQLDEVPDAGLPRRDDEGPLLRGAVLPVPGHQDEHGPDAVERGRQGLGPVEVTVDLGGKGGPTGHGPHGDPPRKQRNELGADGAGGTGDDA
jgi:hypothetical protein